jgi:uncharacterized protein YdcH (DUF465 family)
MFKTGDALVAHIESLIKSSDFHSAALLSYDLRESYTKIFLASLYRRKKIPEKYINSCVYDEINFSRIIKLLRLESSKLQEIADGLDELRKKRNRVVHSIFTNDLSPKEIQNISKQILKLSDKVAFQITHYKH